jgi:chemotaxis protein MotB
MLHRSDEDDDDEEEAESWLASYSDLVTDLMAVFVLLFSFALMSQSVKSSQVSAEKEKAKNEATQQAMEMGTSAEEFVEAVEEKIKLAGLEGQVSVQKESPGAQDSSPGELKEEASAVSDLVVERNENIDKFIKELNEQFKSAGLEGQVNVSRNGEDLVVIRLMDSVLFDRGKAEIKEEVKPTLDSIAGILSKYDSLIRYILIEGHTDNLPINTPQFPSNWELSTGRAGSVVRYLIEKSELSDEKFSSSGYGEFRPIGDNATEEGRSLNRRVEFSIEIKNANKGN